MTAGVEARRSSSFFSIYLYTEVNNVLLIYVSLLNIWYNCFRSINFSGSIYLLRLSLLPENILLKLNCQQENVNTSIPTNHFKPKEQMVLRCSTTACCSLRFEEGPVALHGKQFYFVRFTH